MGANQDIREEISKNSLKHWMVADQLGVTDCTFSKWLRKELPTEKKQRVFSAISNLLKPSKELA